MTKPGMVYPMHIGPPKFMELLKDGRVSVPLEDKTNLAFNLFQDRGLDLSAIIIVNRLGGGGSSWPRPVILLNSRLVLGEQGDRGCDWWATERDFTQSWLVECHLELDLFEQRLVLKVQLYDQDSPVACPPHTLHDLMLAMNMSE